MAEIKKRFGLPGLLKGGALLILVSVTIRWFFLIHQNSVNLLYWDQWDFYQPLFVGDDIWEVFRWQHGPHRQGVGFIVTKFLADFSGWNTRVDAFAIGVTIFMAMLLALVLKARLFGALSWRDILILPVLFLTPLQYEIFANTPNLSHGAMPLLLIILYCLAITLSGTLLRTSLIVFLNFGLVYTGFGLFIGLITPVYFLVEALFVYRKKTRTALTISLAGFLVSGLTLGSFFIDYKFMPAAPNFQFPHPRYWEYPLFLMFLFANFFGSKANLVLSGSIGLFMIGALLTIGLLQIKRSLHLYQSSVAFTGKERAKSYIIGLLAAFTLIFAVNTVVGRIGMGVTAMQASRYIPYLIPGMLGIYLYLASLHSTGVKTSLMSLYAASLIFTTLTLPETDFQTMAHFRERKTQWKYYYLITENVDIADQLSGIKVYPRAEATNLEQKLDFLKARQWNLYLDQANVAKPSAVLAPYYIKLARYYAIKNQLDLVGTYLSAALEGAGQVPTIYLDIGQLLYEIGRHQEAASVYEQAINKGVDNVDIYLRLGDVYYTTNQLKKAQKIYQRAYELAPNNPLIKPKWQHVDQ